MMETVGRSRRSQRAASLTAQVLLNYQIEDENNNNIIMTPMGKQSINHEEFEGNSLFPSKRGRKRSAVDARLLEAAAPTTRSSNFYGKKAKLDTGCSGHSFPAAKPFQVGNHKAYPKKLTASVTPLVKTETISRKEPACSSITSSSSTGVNSVTSNPILLLPVSLQANRTPGHNNPADVGSLSLVTLQAPPDFINCLGFDRAVLNSPEPRDQWKLSSSNGVANPHLVHRFNTKLGTHSFSTVPCATVSCFKHNANAFDCGETQVEPLNLKMGETTIPSTKNTVIKQNVAPVEPKKASLDVMSLPKKPVSSSSNHREIETTKKSKSSNDSKSLRRRSRASLDGFASSKSNNFSNGKKRLLRKSPSPDILVDYPCFSPDVDDVQRKPRCSLNRKRINLRPEVAPVPESLHLEHFLKEQRRLLAAANRAQRAKTKAKAKMEVKKSKPKRNASIDDESINSQDPFKVSTPEQSSNGWEWTGKPYTSLVFSLESGKYVKRKCYPGMFRKDKRIGSIDVVLVRDCIFVMASGEGELSYIGKVTALWEKPSTKEMMISLVWYYRPEHTEGESDYDACEDELFSSRHQDVISVACVEERCHVLTYSQFCRAQARSKRDQLWMKNDVRRIVPPASKPLRRAMLPGETPMRSRDLFFCRYYYDVLPRRIKTKLPPPSALSH